MCHKLWEEITDRLNRSKVTEKLKGIYHKLKNSANSIKTLLFFTNTPKIYHHETLTFSLKCISTNFPNRLLLLLRTVFAFPKASKRGLAIEKEMKIFHQKTSMREKSQNMVVWLHLLNIYVARKTVLKNDMEKFIFNIQFYKYVLTTYYVQTVTKCRRW